MPTTSKPAIQLAPERHVQIKAIAAALGGLSISETVAHFVNREIAEGTIPPGIDGVNVITADGGLKIGLDDQPPVFFSQEAVADLVAALREFAEASKSAAILANMQRNFQIARKGNGVTLTIPFTGEITKTFPRDLARDLADFLEREVSNTKAA